jgi:oxygen-independent coproporphyrinogen-3 oxidase
VTPAGVYVHLPYCRSRCGYCSFVVTTDEGSRSAYLSAVAREAELFPRREDEPAYDALYFGGGTPSLLPPAELARLTARLTARFPLEAGAEVTLEANPDDVDAGKAATWKAAGVNRVSVGVQSLDDRELAGVGRRHDARQARAALETLAAEGFSLSADLILGLPEQTPESFRASLAGIAGVVDHVSLYLLETEKSKEIEEDRRRRPQRYLSDDAQAELWLEAGERLAAAGHSHYEISNWARPGRRARHNVKYWTRTETVGLGISAHELWQGRRRANVSAIPTYLEAVAAGRRPTALDREVGAEEARREEIVLGLRLAEGVPSGFVAAWIAENGDPRLAEDWEAWKEAGLLVEEKDRARFTERGFLLSNDVLCRFV